jgi:hypothetical protein
VFLESCSGYQETEKISNCKSVLFCFAILVVLQPVCQTRLTSPQLLKNKLSNPKLAHDHYFYMDAINICCVLFLTIGLASISEANARSASRRRDGHKILIAWGRKIRELDRLTTSVLTLLIMLEEVMLYKYVKAEDHSVEF